MSWSSRLVLVMLASAMKRSRGILSFFLVTRGVFLSRLPCVGIYLGDAVRDTMTVDKLDDAGWAVLVINRIHV
jgi:hypothetical protein